MSKQYITASDLYNFRKCRYRPFLDYNGDVANKRELHPLVKLLWDAGVQHEDRLINELKERLSDKSFVDIDSNKPTSNELFQKTIAAMKNGYDFIYQGVMIVGNRVGRPDLLVKQSGFSNYGDYLYYPVDIKYATIEDTWDNGDEKLTLPQVWQLYFYGELLEFAQGARPALGWVYKTKDRKLKYDLSKKPKKYDDAIHLLESYLQATPLDAEPAIGGQCFQCEWEKHCVKWAEDHDDISLLYFVGDAAKAGLRKLGIKTIDDLIGKDPTALIPEVTRLKNEGNFWPSMPNDLIPKIIRRARIHRAQKPVVHEKIEFPSVEREIHYDIEDDPTQDFVYLHGLILVEKGKEPQYFGYFADAFKDEERVAKEFIEFINSYEGVPVYHYSPHEKSVLKRLLLKYPSLDQSIFNRLFGQDGCAIDLYKIIDGKTDWPRTSYSIKSLCKYLGYKWAASDASGAASVVWINDYLAGNIAMKDKILQYNEDDCRAMLFLKDKLIEMQK